MTTKLPGKLRFQIGVIVLAWGVIAPATVPFWLVGIVVGAGGFLLADGIWDALGAK